jgi:thiol-disulfide isomerase/thioredoxin
MRASAARALLPIALVASVLVVPVAFAAEALQPWTGGPTPALRLNSLAGDELKLDDFRGRTVIVNFWATWCEPCVAEMPALQRLRNRLAALGIEVIAVNYEENPGRIQPFVERLGLTFPIVRDHDGTARSAWRVNVFPASFVIGPDQRIVWRAAGEIDWDDPRVEAQIRNLR